MAKHPGLYRDPVTQNWTVRQAIPVDVRRAFGGKFNLKQSLGTSILEDAIEGYHLTHAEFKRRIREARESLSAINTERRKQALERIAERWFDREFPESRRRTTREYAATHYNADDYDPRNEWLFLDDDNLHRFDALDDLNHSVSEFAQASGVDVQPQDAERLQEAAANVYAAHYPIPEPTPVASPISITAPADPRYADLKLPDAARSWTEFTEAFLTSEMARKLSNKAKAAYRKSFARLEEVIGMKPIAEVTTIDLGEFKKRLDATPSDKREGKMLDFDTRFRSVSNIRQFFKWAMSEHLAADNPCRKIVMVRDQDEDEENERIPFTTDDLNRIFRLPLFTGCRGERLMLEPGNVSMRSHCRFWYPLVAMFTGMRPNEIEQLEFEDIVEFHGRKHFYVRRRHSAHGHTKSLKTRKSSVRQIPVHSELLRIGFLEWVAERKKISTNGRIFTSYEPMGEWFNGTLLPAIGVEPSRDRKWFYSFRHGFEDALRDATDDAEKRDRFMGHHSEGTGALYGGRDILRSETAVIDRIEFRGVDLSHLRH